MGDKVNLTEPKLTRTLKQTKYLSDQFIKLFSRKNSREQNYIISKSITNLLDIEKNILELRKLITSNSESSNDK
jgi:hypothetical protein